MAIEIAAQGSKTKLSIYATSMEFEDMFYGALLTSDPINNFEVIDIDKIKEGVNFEIVGMYDKIKKHKTKAKQEQMAFVEIKTGNGLLDCTIFPAQFEKYKKIVKKNLVCRFSIRKSRDDTYIINKIEMA